MPLIGRVLLPLLMFVAWLLLAFDLYGILSSGPLLGGEARYSRAWELLWAYGLACLVWILVGLRLYRQPLAGAVWVYMLAAAATVAAFSLMGNGEKIWPAAIVLLLPLMLTGAAFNGHWAALRTPLLIVASVPCVLALIAFGSSLFESQSARTTADAETRRANLAVVNSIGEDQPLWHWLSLVKEEGGVREEALAALRKLKRRQSDVEAMFAEGNSAALELLPLLDLQVTQPIQQGVLTSCLKTAEYARTKPGGGDEILERTFFFEPLPALHWLRAQGGDCRECVAQLKSSALQYQDTKIRARYIKELDSLLQ